ncbi:ATP-binding cassette domain-containing protein [Actinomadura madurae]|uniref:ATP-binding cassette domain-containing protein n=1 Tax=Actinomadura madurae TaxID=1993 RepID=UPI0020D24039|nr:ATP-binding cassette domain-containing protein [Actinomadura madurae]MCP9947429.1 ATP-binding cassette domain-containing protein [Actinomadura madurae]
MAAAEGLLVRDVTVRFGRLTAVDGAGLTAPPGTVTGLIGPNGAGKTTLCDVITGLRRPVAGTVHLGGADLTGSAARERARRGIARTFQRPRRAGAATVRGDRARRRGEARDDPRVSGPDGARPVALPVGGPPGRGRARRRAPRPGRHRGVRRGERALGAARRGAAHGPGAGPRHRAAVLLLDEPWQDLPERNARALEVLLRDLAAEGLTILLAGHELEPVLGVCDALHVLDGGRVIAAGAPAEVRADPRVRDAYRDGPAVTRCRSTGGDAPAVAGPRPARR